MIQQLFKRCAHQQIGTMMYFISQFTQKFQCMPIYFCCTQLLMCVVCNLLHLSLHPLTCTFSSILLLEHCLYSSLILTTQSVLFFLQSHSLPIPLPSPQPMPSCMLWARPTGVWWQRSTLPPGTLPTAFWQPAAASPHSHVTISFRYGPISVVLGTLMSRPCRV